MSLVLLNSVDFTYLWVGSLSDGVNSVTDKRGKLLSNC